MQRNYCDKKCQKNDWKTGHREQCKTLRREAAAGGVGGAAAAAAAPTPPAAAAPVDDGAEHPCPICFHNDDDAIVDGVNKACLPTKTALDSTVGPRRLPRGDSNVVSSISPFPAGFHFMLT